MSLDQQLDTVGASGVTVWKTSTGFQANVRRAGSDGWTVHIAETPSRALAGALAALDARPKPSLEEMF